MSRQLTRSYATVSGNLPPSKVTSGELPFWVKLRLLLRGNRVYLWPTPMQQLEQHGIHSSVR